MATSPQIELRVGRSPSKHYAAARARALTLAGCVEQPGGGFVVRASVADMRPPELRDLATVAMAAFGWKSAGAHVDGVAISLFVLVGALRCWATKLEAKPRAQARHCLPPAPSTPRRTVPESQALPCRVAVVEGARWADFAPGGITDHAGLEAQIATAAQGHPLAWCPGFDVAPVLVQVRKLPRSRASTRAREERAAAKAEAEWQTRMAELGRQMREVIERQDELERLTRTFERLDIDRGGDVMTAAERERIGDFLGVPELRLLPYVGHLSDVQRRLLGQRLREALLASEADD